jgi:hypothetical protein
MTTELGKRNNRVLVIDDNPSIHADFRKILCNGSVAGAELVQASADLFGDAVPLTPQAQFVLTTAFQGEEA